MELKEKNMISKHMGIILTVLFMLIVVLLVNPVYGNSLEESMPLFTENLQDPILDDLGDTSFGVQASWQLEEILPDSNDNLVAWTLFGVSILLMAIGYGSINWFFPASYVMYATGLAFQITTNILNFKPSLGIAFLCISPIYGIGGSLMIYGALYSENINLLTSGVLFLGACIYTLTSGLVMYYSEAERYAATNPPDLLGDETTPLSLSELSLQPYDDGAGLYATLRF